MDIQVYWYTEFNSAIRTTHYEIPNSIDQRLTTLYWYTDFKVN